MFQRVNQEERDQRILLEFGLPVAVAEEGNNWLGRVTFSWPIYTLRVSLG